MQRQSASYEEGCVLWRELPEHLILLCRACHQDYHELESRWRRRWTYRDCDDRPGTVQVGCTSVTVLAAGYFRSVKGGTG